MAVVITSENIIVSSNIDDDLQEMIANKPQAQYWLDGQVMNDIVPLMPHVSGAFINQTRLVSASLQGTGQVCVATGVQGRYLYEGKVMVDSVTGKGARPIKLPTGELIFRHRLGAKLMPSARSLHYLNPDAVPHWYEAAKEQHIDEWKDGVLHILRGHSA